MDSKLIDVADHSEQDANGKANPYPYGWRYVKRPLPDGGEELDQVPLTLEDVLHPQEDDVIPEHPVHVRDRLFLYGACLVRQDRVNNGLILCDCLINWGVKGIRNHSPDVSAFADLAVQPDPPRGTFDLAASGGRCLFLVEIVSPSTRTNDVDRKLDEYFQLQVPFYVIVDQMREGGPREIRAYRYTPTHYAPVPLDPFGRVALKPVGIQLGLENGLLACYESDTGKAILDFPGTYHELRHQEANVRQLAGQLKQAEEQARQEAAARQQAEEQARQEGAARQQAEEQARQETAARQLAEQRLRDLEAELRQLRGN